MQGLDGDITRPWLDDVREWEASPSTAVDVLELLNSKTSPEEPPPWNTTLDALSTGTPSDSVSLYLPAIGDGEALLITSVSRPSAVPMRLGWEGACNYSLDGNQISAVLERWETQFGAVLMRLGFDIVELQVARPPQDAETISTLAREHVLFCPDQIEWGEVNDLEDYADTAIDTLRWSFWWD